MYEMPQQVIPSQLHQPYQAAGQSQQAQQHHQQQQQQQQQSYQSVIQNQQTQPIQNVAHHQTPLGMAQQQQHQHQPQPTQQQQHTHQQGANQNSAFDSTFDSIKSAAPTQQSQANRYANHIGYVNRSVLIFGGKTPRLCHSFWLSFFCLNFCVQSA